MRLIDADALLKEVIRIQTTFADNYCNTEVQYAIENAPTIEPIRHGHWEIDEAESEKHIEKIYICSNCKNNEAWGEVEKTKYCSNCGAKMDEEAEK